MDDSQVPRHPVDASIATVDGSAVLTLQRSLPARASDVWSALTDRNLIARWAPYRPSRDLTETGTVDLPEAGDATDGGDTSESSGEVLSVVAGRMLLLEWGGDTLDFELLPTHPGTVLRLRHTFNDPENAASYAAGWHLCLTALDGVTQGIDVPAMTGERAKLHGWDALHDRYDGLFHPSTESN